jgi:sec-independent protein translocase protein TatA
MRLNTPEIILILIVVLLLFGARRLPDMARSLGRSMRIFKSETKALREDDDEPNVKSGTVIQEPTREINAAAPPPPAADATKVAESERSER